MLITIEKSKKIASSYYQTSPKFIKYYRKDTYKFNYPK